MNNLVYGVGIYLKGKYVCRVNGKQTKEYHLWSSMLQRCYSEKIKNRYPTYKECSVSENFKNFQFFGEWCNNQIGFGLKDYELDKDILFKGNKIYSENTCVFIPKELNNILKTAKKSRGDFPVGVHKKKSSGKYVATISVGGIIKNLGHYDTPEKAFEIYKSTKELILKDKAEQYKHVIDERAYAALLNYVIEIED